MEEEAGSLGFLSPQPKGKKAKGKKVAPAPAVVKKQEAKKVVNPLFEKRPKNFGIGKLMKTVQFRVKNGSSLNRKLHCVLAAFSGFEVRAAWIGTRLATLAVNWVQFP